ncbi:N-acetylmuramoyl-L-alanine amidase [Candidatus Sumerlaeota bacterium]|nr:N-acetylmuramoyl-L-alanine amidase [Candidatus Sumerlaeota bacterium]
MSRMRFFIFIMASALFLNASFPVNDASVVHDPPPPFEPNPDDQFHFPAGNAVPSGDPWLELPPVDYIPPPYARCLKGLRICLDPGHGGYQHIPGYKSTASGYREAVMNLAVARYLRDFLLKSGVVVVMTRDGDWDLKKDYSEALKARPQLAEIHKCDLFISMHHNAHSRKDANFSSVFYHAFPGYIYSNTDLGRTIVDELEYWLRLPEFASNGLYSDYLVYPDSGFAVLRQAHVPAILVEASFFSNAKEEERLRDPEYLKREAWAYYLGIVKYVRNGIPKAELIHPRDGRLSGKEHRIQLKLEDGCPEEWGSKGSPRILKFSIGLTINDTEVPFDYDDETGILTYTPPMPLTPGLYKVMARYVNMRKNSNVPRMFEITAQP